MKKIVAWVQLHLYLYSFHLQNCTRVSF